jgi:hypothetical protein
VGADWAGAPHDVKMAQPANSCSCLVPAPPRAAVIAEGIAARRIANLSSIPHPYFSPMRAHLAGHGMAQSHRLLS